MIDLQGSSQWIQINPSTPFALSSVAIKFQGGFAAKRFAVECRQADGTFTSTAEFYPDDHGKLQISFFSYFVFFLFTKISCRLDSLTPFKRLSPSDDTTDRSRSIPIDIPR